MFISRFGADGRIIEADYSQLEVIIQAVLSGDRHMQQDIREGIDFHVKRLSAVTGEDYSSLKAKHRAGDDSVCQQRTLVKGFTFQRAYGAGAPAIAESTGLSLDQVKDLIRAEEKLYPDLSRFNDSVARAVAQSARDTNSFIKVAGVTCRLREGDWFSPTGTYYRFIEKESPAFMQERGTYVSFSPTEMKNYPIQGMGGEIVQTMIGKLYRHFLKTKNYGGNAFLINTVHDCVLVDCHKDILPQVANEVVIIMEKVPNVFNYYFDMNITVPFPVEAEAGPNWYEMEHIANG